MVRKAKPKGEVRVLDGPNHPGLHEDQRVPGAPQASDSPSAEEAGTSSDQKAKKGLDQEAIAKALGSKYHVPVSEMVVDIGLDISTAFTGVVLMDDTGEMIFMSHVDLTSPELKTLFDKADATIEWMKSSLPKTVRIRRIFVEENAKGYSAGFSSADTLFTLAKINALVSYLSHKWLGVEVINVNVTSARSRIGFKNNKAVKKSVKEKVRDFVLTTNPQLPFQTRTVTKGKDKGKLVPADGVADEIDAWVIVRGGQLIHPSNRFSQRSNQFPKIGF